MKQLQRKTRKSKEESVQQAEHVLRKPQRWNDSYGYHNFKPTEQQQELIDKINSNTLTFVAAPAGTGKTASVLYAFAKEYVRDSSKQLIIIRTPVEAGMDKIGALPDDYKAKTAPHFESTKKILEQMLNRGKVETDMDHRIHFKIPNYCLGATFDNSLIVIDECQQLQPMILKLLLERTGVDSKVVCIGDNTQLYANNADKRNALKDALPRFFDEEMKPLYDDVAFHKFDVKDVMRSDICKTVITAYTGLL
jgi:phosphate starvation-inducible protein PhoH